MSEHPTLVLEVELGSALWELGDAANDVVASLDKTAFIATKTMQANVMQAPGTGFADLADFAKRRDVALADFAESRAKTQEDIAQKVKCANAKFREMYLDEIRPGLEHLMETGEDLRPAVFGAKTKRFVLLARSFAEIVLDEACSLIEMDLKWLKTELENAFIAFFITFNTDDDDSFVPIQASDQGAEPFPCFRRDARGKILRWHSAVMRIQVAFHIDVDAVLQTYNKAVRLELGRVEVLPWKKDSPVLKIPGVGVRRSCLAAYEAHVLRRSSQAAAGAPEAVFAPPEAAVAPKPRRSKAKALSFTSAKRKKGDEKRAQLHLRKEKKG